MDTDESLMSTRQVAEYLSVDPWTVQRWVKEGNMPSHKKILPSSKEEGRISWQRHRAFYCIAVSPIS